MITVADVMNTLIDLPDDRSNPFSSDTEACLYTGENGDHCIAGEILFRLGAEVPVFGSDFNSESIVDLVYKLSIEIEHHAIEILSIGQCRADDLTHHGYDDAWFYAKKDMIDYYEKISKSI